MTTFLLSMIAIAVGGQIPNGAVRLTYFVALVAVMTLNWLGITSALS